MVAVEPVPNFFVAGAPKCGTTALCEYLRSHPNVFMSYPKEPHFFADDFTHFHAVRTFDEYMKLFTSRRIEQTAVGEGSVWYLYSNNALSNIKHFNPSAKIIVTVRNPIDFVQSLHSQNIFGFVEDERNFINAWNLQDERKNGRCLPDHCVAPEFLQYGTIGRFGDQLERLYSMFPEEQVKCIVFDEFVEDIARVYREVLEFLEIPHDGKREFPMINENKVHRSEILGALLLRPPNALRIAWRQYKKVFGYETLKLGEKVIRANSRKQRRAPLPVPFRGRLVEAFREDVDKLSRLLGRDLSHWMAV